MEKKKVNQGAKNDSANRYTCIKNVDKMDATASPDAVKSSMEYVAKLTRTAKKELLPKEEVQTASQTLDSWLAK